jgi:hypothetical protein
VALAAFALVPCAGRALGTAHPPSSFASEIERLSEQEGAFDTDNLISNERSYLQVLPSLVGGGVSGGTYIGVGPDQNFSYIARIRPTVAYIIDIRRDNLLLHLLFKALFARSTTRVEFLSLLTGRAPPRNLEGWKFAPITQIVAHVDGQKPLAGASNVLDIRLRKSIAGFGLPLSSADLQTIGRFHYAFIEGGLALQFHTFGRPPQPYYPTLRDLLMATDGTGQGGNYLGSEEDFQFIKALEARDAIIPVVGNVAGGHAMRALAHTIAEHGSHVSAFYVSNIESYLFRDGSYAQFVDNVSRLPHDANSVVIRAIFGGGGASRSATERIDELVARAQTDRLR